MAIFEKDLMKMLAVPIGRRKLLALAGQGGLGLIIAACTGAAATATPTLRPTKTTLNAVYIPGYTTLDAHLGGAANRSLLANTWEAPHVADYVDFGYVNALAEDIRYEQNGNMIVKLKEGIKFHGGETLTAEDLKWSMDRIGNPDTGSFSHRRFSPALINGTEIIDPLTVRILVKDPPYPTMYFYMDAAFIYPKSWAEDKDPQFLAANSNGTGAYKITRFVPDQFAELEAHDDWWFGKPTFKNVTFRINAEESSRLAALERGDADIMEKLSPELVQVVEANSKLEPVIVNARGGAAVQIWSKHEKNLEDPTQANPLRDIRVRQAMNWAIDRDAIISGILRGFAFPMRGLIAEPSMRGYVPPEELTEWTYDPDKAKSLLRDAGYPNGFKTKFHVTDPRWIKGKEIGEAITIMLKDVGIDVNMVTITRPQLGDLFRKRALGPMHLEGGMSAAINPYSTPDNYLHISGSFGPENGSTFADSEELEAAFKDTQKFTIAEQDVALRKLHKIFWEKVPAIWLWRPAEIWAVSKEILFPAIANPYDSRFGRLQVAP